jgi:enterochelin esterase-like enzyme
MRRISTAVLLALTTTSAPVPPASPIPSTELTLRSQVFHNTRHLHVLLPPGYSARENRSRLYPVCYFLDGIAAFDAWGVPAVTELLWASGDLRPTIFVGIDNGGSTTETTNPVRDRASEYLPYADSSWTGTDAPQPHGRLMPAFLFDEVMPLVRSSARVSADPAATCLAGDSYAGAAALYIAITRPGRFGALLVESPSLHIGNGELLREASKVTAWPARIYLGVGTAEGATRDSQREMLANVRTLRGLIAKAHPDIRLHLEVTPGAAHGYEAWHARLPVALRFLLGP